MHPKSAELTAKVLRVSRKAATLAPEQGRRFALTPEVAAGVRLVLVSAGRKHLVFSLWELREDVAALCGDAQVPSSTSLLAIDEAQARAVCETRISDLPRSPTAPSLRYGLLHYTSCREIRRTVYRLTAAAGPAAAAA
jgi:hypothetical protein